MPWNKNALLRYRTIDKCLQNDHRLWTLNDLIEACSNALYELEGKESTVSKRTIQADIQFMRSDKMGYHAPIVVQNKKYYSYADPSYTITDIPLTPSDMEVLMESVEVLKQFRKFSLFSELNGVLHKLEDKIYTESGNHRSVIHLDKNERLTGLEHLDFLYQSIVKKIVLRIGYQPFSARTPSSFLFNGYLLKEYNNRWFLVGSKYNTPKVIHLALDRIKKLEIDLSFEYQEKYLDADNYYKDTIGVTVMKEEQLVTVVFWADRYNAPYILTKPFHHSQKVLENYADGSIKASIRVHQNPELERLLLGFSHSVKVLEPASLRKALKKKHKLAFEQY